MSTEFLLAKAAEKDRRILELEMRLHEVVQREQALLKQLETLYIEKNREREDKQILQYRVDSLEAELSEYTDGSGLKYVTQEEVTSLTSPYEGEGLSTPMPSTVGGDRLLSNLSTTTTVVEEEPKNKYKHSNQWPRRMSEEDDNEMNIWASPKKRSNWISTCDED
jgi:preprotein translocase subunit SecD